MRFTQANVTGTKRSGCQKVNKFSGRHGLRRGLGDTWSDLWPRISDTTGNQKALDQYSWPFTMKLPYNHKPCVCAIMYCQIPNDLQTCRVFRGTLEKRYSVLCHRLFMRCMNNLQHLFASLPMYGNGFWPQVAIPRSDLLLSSHHGHFFSTYALSNYGFNSQLNMSHASSRSIAQSSLAPPSSLFTLLLIFAPLLSSWTSWSCLSSAICLGSSLILVVIITLRFLSSSLSALHFDFPLTSYS